MSASQLSVQVYCQVVANKELTRDAGIGASGVGMVHVLQEKKVYYAVGSSRLVSSSSEGVQLACEHESVIETQVETEEADVCVSMAGNTNCFKYHSYMLSSVAMVAWKWGYYTMQERACQRNLPSRRSHRQRVS